MAPENSTPKTLESCCEVSLEWRDLQRIDYKFKNALCGKCEKIYEQNLLTGNIYVKDPNSKQFTHLGCGEGVIAVVRSHPIWERGTCAGWGDVEREQIPYCPKHEERPSESGRPVYYKPRVINEDGSINVSASAGFEL